MKLIGLFIPLLLTLSAHAAEAPRACVPSTGLSVGGISLADTRVAAISKLGKPKTIGTYQGEDDGGLYTGTTLIYSQMELDVDELRGIERIASTGPNAHLPFGLKAGLSLQQAANLLHFIPGALDRGMVVLPVCGVDEGIELRLHFADDALRSVEVVQYGP
jgi:hypothetical protein